MRIVKNLNVFFLFATCLIFTVILAALPSNALFAADSNIFIEKDVPVTMRDGVKLMANVYRPNEKGTFPVLVFRTPYSKDEGDPNNESTFNNAVKRGYAVVIQDIRGRFKSAGDFDPYKNEGKDGYDTIEWAAAQPWSDGNIGSFGLSYPGAVQWLAAVENPPHLKAMVPAMCFSTLRQFIYFGGVFELDWTQWCYWYMSPDARIKKNLPGARTWEDAEAEYKRIGVDAIEGFLPTLDMPYLKDTAPYYYDWIRHQPYESYWDFGDLHDKYGKVKAAVLNLSGWHDEAYGAEGATTNFLGLLKERKGDKDPRTKLIIGPWRHGVGNTKKTYAGDRDFGPLAKIDYDKIVLDWLDYHVRGINNDVASWKPVRVFVMGDNKWIDSDEWPLKNTKQLPLYLSKDGNGKSSLRLQQIPGLEKSSFVSDPANPVKDKYGTSMGAFDLSYISARSDVLTFDTETLDKDIEVVGNVGAEICLSADAPDCDLFVKVLDVFPDGKAYNIMPPGKEVMRISYRDKTPDRKLLSPGQVVKLNFENMRTGNTFKKGHTIRVCITASWYPIYARNLQTGELESLSSKMRKATINIHHGGQYQSRIILPVIPAE